MMTTRSIFAALTLLLLAACATEVPTHVKEKDLGLLWVKHSAEYEAITRQVYRNATDALPRMVADTSWTAQPDQRGAEDLPPAVILDVDETVINNVSFQLAFEPPFTDRKLEMWDRNHTAEPVPGVVEFIEAARAAGVTPFFLTNRPCEKYEDENELCTSVAQWLQDVMKCIETLLSTKVDRSIFLFEDHQSRIRRAR